MIYRGQVLRFLQEKQETEGGYTGNDLTILAELLHVTPQGLRKRLSTLIRTDKEFSQFIYLGKEKPPITLFEFFKIERGLAKSTFYRNTNQKILSMFGSDQNNWFKVKEICFPDNYSLEKNRESLKTIFTFSDMKIYGGADIDGIHKRLVEAKEEAETKSKYIPGMVTQ